MNFGNDHEMTSHFGILIFDCFFDFLYELWDITNIHIETIIGHTCHERAVAQIDEQLCF